MRCRIALTALAALVVDAAALAAQAAPPPPPPPLTFTADIGFVSTSGNSNVTTLSAGNELKFTNGPWAYTQTSSAVYARLRDSVTSSKWRAGLRAERSFTPWIGAYGLVNYDKDRFSGIDGRFEEGVGAAIKALASPTDKIDVELGVSAVQMQPSGGLPSQSFISGRTKGVYRHLFSEKRYIQQAVEYLPNLQNGADWRFNSETSVIAPVASHLGLKVSYVFTYQHLPPVGFGDTDRVFSTSLQISF